MATNPQPTVYISTTNTAKLIRQVLKREFPAVSFSVRSHTYSGGSSIDVHWTDGPTVQMVEDVTKYYQGATFDGQIDLKSYVSRQEGGEEVHYGVDWVMTHRNVSRESMEKAIAAMQKDWGWDHQIEVKETDSFGAYIASPPVFIPNAFRDDHEIVLKALSKMDFSAADTHSSPSPAAGLTWRRNPAKHGLELLGKPDEYTRETLKGLGFRWGGKLGYWYAPETPDRLLVLEQIASPPK